MKLFLDDCRVPNNCINYMKPRIGENANLYKEEWEIVRNYNEFCKFIDEHKGKITIISFDHDLAETHYNPETWVEGFEYTEETGLDCAIYFKKVYDNEGLKYPQLIVHSMNNVGTERIKQLFL